MLTPRILGVAQLTAFIKDLIENNEFLSRVWLKGEIANFKPYPSGHVYFTLRDNRANIKCVMFKQQAHRLRFKPEDGLAVIARGYVSVFERDGQYQLYVQELQLDGVGELYLSFQKLKDKLEKEGLFASARKRTIPILPSRIGIVTSPTGAVIQDIINIIERRCPGVQLILSPAAVQGLAAPDEICRALEVLYSTPGLDVIIVGRGGGSIEDLWAFNNESVARAIARSPVPVISAVGHETDFTIADFVADLRAPTPSAAAELVVPAKYDLINKVRELQHRLFQCQNKRLAEARQQLAYLAANSIFKRPEMSIRKHRQELDVLTKDLINSINLLLCSNRQKTEQLACMLDLLGPLKTLARGYGICLIPETKQVVTNAKCLAAGQKIEVILSKGSLICLVEEVLNRNNGP
ncbi:MAG: exodeoxyribonuclease VII large subunit [Bacillota bacterium]